MVSRCIDHVKPEEFALLDDIEWVGENGTILIRFEIGGRMIPVVIECFALAFDFDHVRRCAREQRDVDLIFNFDDCEWHQASSFWRLYIVTIFQRNTIREYRRWLEECDD